MVVSEGRRKAAEAQGTANGARALEEKAQGLVESNPDQARALAFRARQGYLDAAEAYKNAARFGGTEQEVGSWNSLGELYLKKARALAPVQLPVSIRQGGSGGDLEDKFEIQPEKSSTTFAQVAGLDNIKEQVSMSIIQPLNHPEIFRKLGLEPGGGILLYGPPGCGKTFIGKAAAGECKANFYNVKISDILSKYVGESEQHFAKVVYSAAQNAPSIVFLDEIDALGVSRDSADASHTARLVNQILSSMDGFSGKDTAKPVFWMATTNRPWAVDPAIRRPGRLDETVFVPLPDKAARRKILELNTSAELVKLSPQDYDILAEQTEAYTGADLVFIAKGAKKIIAREVLAGRPVRPATLIDFQTSLSQTKKSLIPWLIKANNEIERSGESAEYPDLVNLIKKYLPNN